MSEIIQCKVHLNEDCVRVLNSIHPWMFHCPQKHHSNHVVFYEQGWVKEDVKFD